MNRLTEIIATIWVLMYKLYNSKGHTHTEPSINTWIIKLHRYNMAPIILLKLWLLANMNHKLNNSTSKLFDLKDFFSRSFSLLFSVDAIIFFKNIPTVQDIVISQ